MNSQIIDLYNSLDPMQLYATAAILSVLAFLSTFILHRIEEAINWKHYHILPARWRDR